MPGLTTNGPTIVVKLWVPRSVQSNLQPIDTLAEINMAYNQTFIQEGIATSLGLQPCGTTKIATATKPLFETYVYQVRVVLPDRAFEVMAAEIPYMLRPRDRIKCLIGRDILQYYTLTYNGPDDTFSLEFKEAGHG